MCVFHNGIVFVYHASLPPLHFFFVSKTWTMADDLSWVNDVVRKARHDARWPFWKERSENIMIYLIRLEGASDAFISFYFSSSSSSSLSPSLS